MGVRERRADLGSQRARAILVELGGELHRARLEHGLSQAAVAAAVGMSRSQVSRIENALVAEVPLSRLARLMAVVGLELSARAYPAGSPIHDRAHRALLERLRARASPAAVWRFEVPLGRPGDLRAWDAVLRIAGRRLAVEAETRPRDVQALQRRVSMKLRDDREVSGVLLLLADTRHNRSLLREHGEALRADLPLAGAEILRSLAAGRHPAGSGIVLV
jgi:transcriptional regulator with XRE-family HTH domain